MNAREKFLEILNFNDAITLKWEFGFWGSTIKNWYNQGLPKKEYPRIPTEIRTTSASLYTTAWTHEWQSGKRNLTENKELEIPNGIGVWGGFLYQPSQGFPQDKDVASYFDFDKPQSLALIEQFFYPQFEIKILEEDEESILYIDLDGVTRKYLRKEATIPTSMKWPITDWDSWNKIKEERLKIDDIEKRFPKDWKVLLDQYQKRDYPLVLGGYPVGFFGTPAHLLGYENLFLYYYDKPDLIKDMLNTFTDIWLALWEEVSSQVEIDAIHIWEDVSSGTASMVSPATFKEFMAPYYKKVTDFAKAKKINHVLVDTDGDCNELIPLLMETGVTGMYPMEASAGMDVFAAKKKYPDLQIMGGIPKSDIAKGKEAIDKMLEPIAKLLKMGGYIPFGDHLVPPEVDWQNYKYYREKLNRLIDKKGHI